MARMTPQFIVYGGTELRSIRDKIYMYMNLWDFIVSTLSFSYCDLEQRINHVEFFSGKLKRVVPRYLDQPRAVEHCSARDVSEQLPYTRAIAILLRPTIINPTG